MPSSETPTYSWKAKVGGSHPAVAYSPDGLTVYATTTHGVVILDAKRGNEKERIEAENSSPVAIEVFPVATLSAALTILSDLTEEKR